VWVGDIIHPYTHLCRRNCNFSISPSRTLITSTGTENLAELVWLRNIWESPTHQSFFHRVSAPLGLPFPCSWPRVLSVRLCLEQQVKILPADWVSINEVPEFKSCLYGQSSPFLQKPFAKNRQGMKRELSVFLSIVPWVGPAAMKADAVDCKRGYRLTSSDLQFCGPRLFAKPVVPCE